MTKASKKNPLENETYRRLIIRLSSLGDVVLSTAVLSINLNRKTTNDWVVASEYGELIESHPNIRKVWKFKRKSGFLDWIKLCRELWLEEYDEVLDLHTNVRSKTARLLFKFWDLTGTRKRARWIVASKERWKTFGAFTFKGIWPAIWKLKPCTQRFTLLAGGLGTEKPNLTHLLSSPVSSVDSFFIPQKPYVCVMPSAAWPGKIWPATKYAQAINEIGIFPVILGSAKDQVCDELVSQLSETNALFLSGVGIWSLSQNAQILAHSVGYIGSDTGLFHLAEAMGIPAIVLFGPNLANTGFGPWRPQSRVVDTSLWCRPCGKDGRYCFRPKRRYLCLQKIQPSQVVDAFKSVHL